MPGTVAERRGQAPHPPYDPDVPRHRTAYLWLTAALAAVVIAAVVLAPSGEPVEIPAPLERIFPAPGDTVVRQTAVEIDLPVGYSIELFVDGVPIPSDEIGSTASTGVYVWRPAPGGTIETWPGGEHTVRVAWDRTEGGRPDPGEYEWVFRVQ
jgi:hypothetical protein